MGSSDAFSRARDFLQNAEFNDLTTCRALSIQHMGALGHATWDELDSLPEALRWCINVFLRTALTKAAEARAICGEAALESMLQLNLLRPAKYDRDSLVCPAWLYPVDGFIVASDLKADPDGDPYLERDDVVFPANDEGTIRFLRLMPDAPGGTALDLCGGCGIGALHQSRTARVAVTSDITPRAASYADFNIALNGAAATSLRSDLYEEVGGGQFDVITAHPPFVPSAKAHVIYRDGGDTGEDITRRIIEGLPTYLRPGGAAVILCAGNDNCTGNFEERAFSWLGDSGPEFEIVFGMQRAISLESVVESARRQAQRPISEQDAMELHARLLKHKVRQLAYGMLLFQRHKGRIDAKPIRVPMAITAEMDEFRKLLTWRSQTRRADFTQWFRTARPRLASRLQCNARYTVEEGRLVSDEFIFNVQGGIPWTHRAEIWMVPLLSGIDGSRTVLELYETMCEENSLPEHYNIDEFARKLSEIVERGFLEVDLV